MWRRLASSHSRRGSEIWAETRGSAHLRGTFLSSLIPVLVTGIQPRRVCAVNESMPLLNESLVPKDLGTLDSCDKHRNEGSWWSRALAQGRP
ncbi:hypothetical protein EFB14_26995 [Rhizobium fabae]|nr:hypothetical protein EFB14_26995 [Rhizobium fabae]